ncbi:hypothetical protein HPB48_019718 [Haemaphysalis longicornis]|uniref:Uncharacterized protein n=1 Tax=Haemaphysalis longicornis TaxID=44386 RepID=A0A9J6GV97_HAELO|nr:hypothetical protein HPB48_019718 [Haemaphysalis longicornis]
MGAAAYEVLPNLKPPPGTVRGVIHESDQGTTMEQLPYILTSNEPMFLKKNARMLGASTSAVVTFVGPYVHFYIKAYGLFTLCRAYRQTVQYCSLCGELRHRQDVCPNPDASLCAYCLTTNPTRDHECAFTCQLCGLDHPMASKDCCRKLCPPPPPVRVRDRASAKQQTFHNVPNRQT